jgi:hypothetical protein
LHAVAFNPYIISAGVAHHNIVLSAILCAYETLGATLVDGHPPSSSAREAAESCAISIAQALNMLEPIATPVHPAFVYNNVDLRLLKKHAVSLPILTSAMPLLVLEGHPRKRKRRRPGSLNE